MWIKTIPYEEADDELRAVYDRQARALGKPTETTMVGSLYPRLAATRLDLYAVSERCPSNLTKHQRNLISFVTSALNDVTYCSSQATIKLRETGLDNDQIITLANDPDSLDLSPPIANWSATRPNSPGRPAPWSKRTLSACDHRGSPISTSSMPTPSVPISIMSTASPEDWESPMPSTLISRLPGNPRRTPC